ncbi:uncharacterized protein LOC123519949 isoform X2 [Portunus trituberculatus]|nr:uncharacterized protein LOC123519949 isoform X2 [Portunus trituberculatus]XP_045137627.1 uncharacterized protein LOC123519949 isoform X2 [Portunus trituberculatus]XP_045137628.1 uncharacterized protein LOC123519949 isoform X2 [Portunus trituberculatus]
MDTNTSSTSAPPPPPPDDPTGAVAAVLAGRPNPVNESAEIDELIASVTAEASAVAAEVAASSKKKKKKPKAGGAQADEEDDGLTDELKEKLKAAELRTLNALNVVRGTLDGLSNYKQQLREYGDEQLRLEEEMKAAIEHSRRIRATIRQEEERVVSLLEESHVREPEDDGEGRRV